MKKTLYTALGLLLLAGCGSSDNKEERTASDIVKEYRESLEAEANARKMKADSCRDAASTLGDQINNLLRDFVSVNNQKEVAPYSIFQGWQGKYPLQQTGLLARMTDTGVFELVGTLKGGVFDRITVTSGTESASTAEVPNDQALNYRQNGLTRVMFTGPEADEVGKLIMNNELNPITVTYMNGGKVTGSWKMPHDYAKMISMTAMVTSKMAERTRLEREGMRLSEELKITREHAVTRHHDVVDR